MPLLTWRDGFLEDRDELHSVPSALSSLGRCRLPRSAHSGIIFLQRGSVGASHGAGSVCEEGGGGSLVLARGFHSDGAGNVNGSGQNRVS